MHLLCEKVLPGDFVVFSIWNLFILFHSTPKVPQWSLLHGGGVAYAHWKYTYVNSAVLEKEKNKKKYRKIHSKGKNAEKNEKAKLRYNKICQECNEVATVEPQL